MKTAQIFLPYFKRGDDLAHFLKQTNSIPEALDQLAHNLKGAVHQVQLIRTLVAGKPVNIEADAHMIVITGPDDVINLLIERDLASPWEGDEE